MIIRHLLPNARAWRITVEKQLREFLTGLSGIEVDVVAFFDGVRDDLFPGSTRDLDAWDDQFGLRSAVITEAERRDRLAAAWSAVGGQSPGYIQDTLQANGFDVFVHEWWVPGTEAAINVKAAATPRSPILWLAGDTGTLSAGVNCGEALAECGEAFAQCGNSTEPLGFALVNKTPGATYIVPSDTALWPYFLYIGGEVFGTLATVDAARKDEFEFLCLKICPTQIWLGMLVEYS